MILLVSLCFICISVFRFFFLLLSGLILDLESTSPLIFRVGYWNCKISG